MNEMNTRYNERDYDNRGYREYDYRDDYRYDYRDDYRNYRDDYRTRDYDRRGGRINNRSYRNYRGDYYEELEMIIDDMKETSRSLEDLSEMAKNMNEKNMITKVAQKEKEHAMTLKQMLDRGM